MTIYWGVLTILVNEFHKEKSKPYDSTEKPKADKFLVDREENQKARLSCHKD